MDTESPHDASSGEQVVSERSRAARIWRVLAWTILALLAIVLFVPLVWPVPEIPDAVEARDLAGPDSEFIEVEGIEHHVVRAGEGGRTVILLHGFGASTFSWRDTLPDVAARASAVAFDRPGFGLTERKLRGEWEGPNPYSPTTQADRVIGLMDELGIDEAVLVGHSAGGTVAVLAAARHPERISGLVLEAPAIYIEGGAPRYIRPLLATPQARRIGPLIVRRAVSGDTGERLVRAAWADPTAVTDEIIEGYRAPLAIRDWDRALWEVSIAPRPDRAADALDQIQCPVLVVAGTEDQIVPYDDSVRVAEALGARLATFEATGHIPHEERPERFSTEVWRFLDELEPCPT